MADPISIAAMGVSAASGIVGAFGAAAKDDATSAMYNYKAGVAQANQVVAQQNADYAIQVGGVKAEQEGLKGGQVLGQQKAAAGASGFDANTGSNAIARVDQGKAIKESEGIIVNDAARKAYGYKVEGMNFSAEGQLDTASADYAQEQKGFDVASSLLGGATSVADKWAKFSRVGALTS